MTDPLSKVPPYMRKRLNTRKSKYYKKHLGELNEEIEGSEEDMIDFLKEQGAFFYSLDEVLSDDMVTHFRLADIAEKDGKPRTDWAEAFKRAKAPDYPAIQGGQSEDNVVKEFNVTEACMKTNDPIASLNSKSQSSEATKKIWPVDIFGIPFEDVKSSQVAHLLPDAPAHAIEWYDVACWAMGYDPTTIEWEEVFRLLHGTKTGKKRVYFGAGMRHFVANKARINEQEKLLDKNDPQMLILPVLSRERCLKWDGEDYDAIILMGTDKDRKSYLWAADAVGMTNTNDMKASHASEENLNLALTLMRQMTYALVQSLVHLKPPQVPSNASDDAKEAMEEAIKKQNDRIAAFTNLMGSKTVQVPNQKGCLPVDKQPLRGVCKISFSNDKENNLHGPPDPLLLVARAAVVFSVRKNYRLRASPIAEDDYDWERDAMQFEYLEQMTRHRNLDKTTDGMEIAVADQPEDSDDESTVSLDSHDSHSCHDRNTSPQRENHANLQADFALPNSLLCNRVENVM